VPTYLMQYWGGRATLTIFGVSYILR